MSVLTVSKKPKAPAVSRRPGSLLDPLASLDSFVEEMHRKWSRMLSGLPNFPVLSDERADWAPSVDLYEEGDEMVLKADLPGMKRDDIDLSIENGDLVIRGERSDEKKIDEENCYRLERSRGVFLRRMALPSEVEADAVSARFQDGVLEVRFPRPKAEEVEAAKIHIV